MIASPASCRFFLNEPARNSCRPAELVASSTTWASRSVTSRTVSRCGFGSGIFNRQQARAEGVPLVAVLTQAGDGAEVDHEGTVAPGEARVANLPYLYERAKNAPRRVKRHAPCWRHGQTHKITKGRTRVPAASGASPSFLLVVAPSVYALCSLLAFGVGLKTPAGMRFLFACYVGPKVNALFLHRLRVCAYSELWNGKRRYGRHDYESPFHS
jgi:hypothetical protein